MSVESHTRAVDPDGELWGEGDWSFFSDTAPPPPPVPDRSALPSAPARRPAEVAEWLVDAGVVIVSERDLRHWGVPNAKRVLRALREAELVWQSKTRGVFTLRDRPSSELMSYYDLQLACHLHAHPDSGVMWGPMMLPVHEGWTPRSCPFHYCLPPSEHIPCALRGLSPRRVHRWEVKAPTVWYQRTPCWRYETEIVYAAARPRKYPVEGIFDFLRNLADASQAHCLMAELTDQPRSVWMRTCLLLRYGGRSDLAEELHSLAPVGSGPYYFVNQSGSRSWRHNVTDMVSSVWHPDLELVDFAVDDALVDRTTKYGYFDAMPEWAQTAFTQGREGANAQR